MYIKTELPSFQNKLTNIMEMIKKTCSILKLVSLSECFLYGEVLI
jgi:hypothetical protein